MVANSQTVVFLSPTNVQSSSACSSMRSKSPHHPVVEVPCGRRGPLEPARDGVAGMARDPGRRRNAHAFDA